MSENGQQARGPRVRITLGLAYDAVSYEEAGKLLDQVMLAARQPLLAAAASGMKPNFDITAIESTPCRGGSFHQREERLLYPHGYGEDRAVEVSPGVPDMPAPPTWGGAVALTEAPSPGVPEVQRHEAEGPVRG